MRIDFLWLFISFLVMFRLEENAASEIVEALNWGTLAEELNTNDPSAIPLIHTSWSERKPEFFKTLKIDGVILLLASNIYQKDMAHLYPDGRPGCHLVSQITREEFALMENSACKTFAQCCFPLIKDPLYLPLECRNEFLKSGDFKVQDMKHVPLNWFEEARETFIKQLTADHLNSLSVSAFSILVRSGQCKWFNPLALSKLNQDNWNVVTPDCFASIENPEYLEIPIRILKHLRYDIFSLYNGPLYQQVIESMTPAQAESYASRMALGETLGNFTCQKLNIKLLSPEAAARITSKCLYGYLSTAVKKSRELGAQWVPLEFPFLKSSESMMNVVAYIHPKDYSYMSENIIDKIFGTKVGIGNLPNSYSKVFSIGKRVGLKAKHFKALVDYSGAVAGRFLLLCQFLPDDVFSLFEATDYAKLNGIIQEELLVGDFFIQFLALHRHNFESIIANSGLHLKDHYCATLKTPQDYLEKFWLREKARGNCWKALPFEIDNAIRLQAPELNRGDRSWYEFVRADYNELVKFAPRVLKDLFQMSDFCIAFQGFIKPDLLFQLPTNILRGIGGRCAAYFWNAITPEIASKLGDDAFSHFTSTMFIPRLKLSSLRPAQISWISRELKDTDEAHVFTCMSTQDLLSLDKDQIEAVKPDQLLAFLNRKDHLDLPLINFFISKAVAFRHDEMLKISLHICESLLKSKAPGCWDCAKAIKEYIKVNESSHLKNQIARWCPFLKVTMAQNVNDLKAILLKGKHDFPDKDPRFYLGYEDFGVFDRAETLAMLRNYPEDFAHRDMEIQAKGFVDAGGPSRALVWQMLNDLYNSITETASDSNPSHRKFSWLVGGDAGFLTGLLLGKGLQLNLKPPYSLEESFWKLLTNPTDENIEGYYDESYKSDRDSYCLHALQQNPSHPFDATQVPYVTPEALTFLTLDVKSNIYTPLEGRETLDTIKLKSLTRENIIKEYFIPLNKVILQGFKVFVWNFLKGFGQSIWTKYLAYTMKDDKNLVELFKVEPLFVKDFLSMIIFGNEVERTMIDSLIPGFRLSIANVIRSFIRALTLSQLAKFLRVWTNLSFLSKDSPPKAVLAEDCVNAKAFGYFWIDHKTREPGRITLENREDHIVIAGGDEYFTLIKSASKFQNEMLKLETLEPDPFDKLIATAHDGESIGSIAQTCFQLLQVCPQPAGALLHSLVVLTNMSTGDFVG